MRRIAGLEEATYQDVLRIIGRLLDTEGWHSVRLSEHDDGIVLEARHIGEPGGSVHSFLLSTTELQAMLRSGAALRGQPLAVPAPDSSRPEVVVSPRSGPIGTSFEISGHGFDPNASFKVRLRDPVGGMSTGPEPLNQGGNLRVPLAWQTEVGDPIGDYLVIVATSDSTNTVLASSVVTVTAPPAVPDPTPPPPTRRGAGRVPLPPRRAP